MKCQKCAKPATFHITDIIEKGKHREYHFCDEHARQHLAPPEESLETPSIGDVAKKLIVNPPGESSPAVGRGQAGLPGLPDHISRVSQLGEVGLPL